MIRQMPAGHNDTGDVLCCIQKETGASKNDKARLGWNELQRPTARIIEIIGQKPLFGHTSGKGGKTIWMCFLKNEKSNETHL